MQSLEIIRSNLKKREACIARLLKTKKGQDEPENFHQLRLEIKKTRAALSLLSKCSRSIDFKTKMAPYLNLFKQAGKIRELQLHKLYLDKHSKPEDMPVYSKTLEKQTAEEIKQFCNLKNHKETKPLSLHSDTMRLSPLNVNEHILESTLEKEQDTILKLLEKEKLKVPQVHDLRKRIKSFLFLSTLLPIKKKKLKHLNEFQELLGKWHDYEVFGEELQKADKLENVPPEEKKKIRKLKPKVVQKRQTLFKKIDKSRFSLIKN
ncbi:MAG: CHAD domain-containing protein [Bacteroidia bacterium]|jgi:CHAD domain-containing protein|nr:CHAD domain-containing protein [Bacteroidia bacterium]